MRTRDLRAEWEAEPARFGRLEPIRFLRRVRTSTIWLFRCACGQHTEAKLGNVVSGQTTSCGCVRKETAARIGRVIGGRNKLPDFGHPKRWLYHSYQTRARKSGRAFLVSYDAFCDLITRTCYICGQPPANMFRRDDVHYEFLYNGIDRLDNDQGYVDGNMAPCCKNCNIAKRDRSIHEFYAWINQIQQRSQA